METKTSNGTKIRNHSLGNGSLCKGSGMVRDEGRDPVSNGQMAVCPHCRRIVYTKPV